MDCSVWDALQDKCRIATLREGKYAESLKGIAKTNEHRELQERLELETRAAFIALSQHEKEHSCRS
jgi:hypothetical protein